MDAISKVLESVFGSSWRTSLFGLVGGLFCYFSQLGVAIPTNASEWKTALVSAGIFAWSRVMKDAGVSNAPKPGDAKDV